MGEDDCGVDGDCGDGDGDGDGNNDNVGGMTGMAVLSQTEGVGGEDNNGCGVSRIFTHFHSDCFSQRFFGFIISTCSWCPKDRDGEA